jgi:hypothetical protein
LVGEKSARQRSRSTEMTENEFERVKKLRYVKKR